MNAIFAWSENRKEQKRKFDSSAPTGYSWFESDSTKNICGSEALTTVVTDTQNSTYRGQVNAKNERHGQGRCIYKAWNRGSIYEGEYKNNLGNGFGVMRFNCAAEDTVVNNDGGMYAGHWQDDKKHGHDRLVYNNGDVYEGEWRRGLRYGQGRMVSADGTVVEGKWWRGRLAVNKKKKVIASVMSKKKGNK
eukprot:gene22116-28218_t